MLNKKPKFSPRIVQQKSAIAEQHFIKGNKDYLDAHDCDPGLVILLDESLKGQCDSKLYFSNFLQDNMYLSELEKSVEEFLKKPSLLGKELTNMDFQKPNGERIKNIFSTVLPKHLIEEYYDVFYETDLDFGTHQIGQRDKFRGFLIYMLDKADISKTALVLFLLDPYHLVCPVKQGKKSSYEFMKSKFFQVKDYDNTFAKAFKKKIIDSKLRKMPLETFLSLLA